MVEVSGYFTTVNGPTTFPPPTCDPQVMDFCTVAHAPWPNGPTSEVVPTSTPFLDPNSTLTSTTVSDTQITITSTLTDGSSLFCSTGNTPCPDVFNGLVFAFSENNPITLVTVNASTPADFQPFSVSWNANTIYVNLIGASPAVPPVDGDQLVLDVVARTVPEPSAWALLIVGFVAFGWAAWRKRALRAA